MKIMKSDEILKRYDQSVSRIRASNGRGGKRPFGELEIGDGFVLPYEDEFELIFQNRISAACNYWGKKLGRKFVTRKTDDGVLVIRVS